MDKLILGNREFNSRLLIGTGKFSCNSFIPNVCKESESQIITVAIRRIDPTSKKDSLFNNIPKHMTILPNTSGARTAEEAVKIARISRELGLGDFIKIEVIRDNKYLLPDGNETLKATDILAKEGFIVLPYVNADLYIARDLVNAGASAVMPLGSPIGSNRGIKCIEMIRILIDQIDIPIIVDAGLGSPSDAALAMEIGASACLVNTAIATSSDPLSMAKAFNWGVKAGRTAYLSGLSNKSEIARASSPLTGFLC